MKIKQISLRAFEIDPRGQSDEAIWRYLIGQEALLRRFLLLFLAPLSPELMARLHEAGFSVAIRQGELVQKAATRSPDLAAKAQPHAIATQVRHKPVRSGERIEHGGDLIAFGRINSGAELFIEGNCTLLGTLDGMLSCEGEVAILHSVGRSAVVIFGGELVAIERLGATPLRLHKADGKIVIESLT